MRPTQLLSLVLVTTVTGAAQPALAKLEVHEWGTFTSLVGSNGLTQNGMYHEDEPLPGFVHPFGEVVAERPKTGPTPEPDPQPTPEPQRPCRHPSKICMELGFLRAHPITQKMETPVLYFYSDRTRDVSVNVKFPQGVITETYPGPIATSPTRETVKDIANGDTTFNIRVLAPNVYAPVPFVDRENIYGHARNVASNTITSNGENEKYIFYRGVGQYQPRFSITSNHGALQLLQGVNNSPEGSFLIDVDKNGDARLMTIGAVGLFGSQVSAETIAQLKDHKAAPTASILNGDQVKSTMINALVNAGLNLDEATAMIATWERGYLRVPGLRLLTILQPSEVDSILPLTIVPKPDKVTRVFVSRIEVLLDTEEQQILSDITSQQQSFDLSTLGRFAEAKLRRVMQVCTAGPCKGLHCLLIGQDIQALIDRSMKSLEQSGSSSIQ